MTINKDQEWVWKSVEDLDLEPQAKISFKKMIDKRKFKQINREDRLIWAVSKTGQYSVKKGYKTIINSQKWEEINIP